VPEPPARTRLDDLLDDLGLAATRSQARHLILAGCVTDPATGTALPKPGKALPHNAPLHLAEGPRYVSRAGGKLAAALDHFTINPAGLDCLDLGASTGGFTDCLLQRGAATATCVDVGHGQLHPSLAADPRVTLLEGLNVRGLPQARLPRTAYPLIVMDLSFISLKLALPPAWSRLTPGGHLVVLVKPQFEVTAAEAARSRGIIRDPALHKRALAEVTRAARALPAAALLGPIPSPVTGADGNREFLLALRRGEAQA